MKQVLIEWVDSCGVTPNWEYLSTLKFIPCLCKSSGFLIHKDEVITVICQNLANMGEEENTQVLGCMTIPNVCITKEKVIG